MEIGCKEIRYHEVLKYLGHRGSAIPDEVEKKIRSAMDLVRNTVHPRYCTSRFGIDHRDGLRLENAEFTFEGLDIRSHLEECAQCICMAVTLGGEIETLIRRTQITDMSEAVILDCCASAAVESVCDELAAMLEAQLKEEGLFLTDRFSPGYGDMPILQQQLFCKILDTARRIGLHVSDSGILLPRKSVTAVIGIATTPQEKRSRGCEYCNLFLSCPYRREGVTCDR